MGLLLDRLAEKQLLLSDGAWGTMLQDAGLGVGECPEKWNLTNPDQVRRVALAYVEAGSDLILSNTFGGNCFKLGKFGLAGEVVAINRAGAGLSMEAAGRKAVAVASIGPCGEFLEPYGDVAEEAMFTAFFEQVKALAEGGIGAVCVETMTAVEEAVLAVRAAKEAVPGMEVICTMTFEPVSGGFRTMMGVDCRRAAEELAAAGADIIGANCGNGMTGMREIAVELGKYSNLPILIHANAGLPELVNGRTVFRETPETMADAVAGLVEAGAVIVGGCCGSTPAHIQAMGEKLRALR